MEAQIERGLADEQAAKQYDKTEFGAVTRATPFFLKGLRIDIEGIRFSMPEHGTHIGAAIKALHVEVDGKWHALTGPVLDETFHLLRGMTRAIDRHLYAGVEFVQDISVEVRVHALNRWHGPDSFSAGTWPLSREALDLKPWLEVILPKLLENWSYYKDHEL